MRTPVCELLGIEHPIVQAPVGPAAVPGSQPPSRTRAPGHGVAHVALAKRTQPAADIVAELTSRLPASG